MANRHAVSGFKMKKEISAGAVTFRKDKEVMYLILHYKRKHWDLPKGKIEAGETEIETLKREIKEETGIDDVRIIEGFKDEIRYFYEFKGEKRDKKVFFYLAQTKEDQIKLSFEHIGFKWLNFKQALDQLTFDNAKEVLKKADRFLSRS